MFNIEYMKETLEAKKKELLASMDQNMAKLQHYENLVMEVTKTLVRLEGAIAAVDELLAAESVPKKDIEPE